MLLEKMSKKKAKAKEIFHDDLESSDDDPK
jgi:hypothetical protein